MTINFMKQEFVLLSGLCRDRVSHDFADAFHEGSVDGGF